LLVATTQTAHAGGGSDKWYSNDYEFNYFEALLVIIYVIVAIIFEEVWHYVNHLGTETYSYGHYHEDRALEKDSIERDSHGNIKHRKLYKELISRMGGEFMTLGLLAFLIFVLNQTGGFNSIAKSIEGKSADGFAHPEIAIDLFHLAEVVHIQLFLTMFLYFILILCLVRGSIRKMKKWEKLRFRHRTRRRNSQGSDQRELAAGDIELEKHLSYRECVIMHMLEW